MVTYVSLPGPKGGQYSRLDEPPMIPLQPEEGSQDLLSQGQPRRVWKPTDVISNIWFSWMNDIIHTGSVRALELEDCVVMGEQDSASVAERRLREAWEKEKTRAQLKGKKPSVMTAFLRTFAVEYFLLSGSLRLARVFVNLFMTAYILPLLLNYIQNKDDNQNYLDGLLIALLMAGANFTLLVVYHQNGVYAARIGLRMRSSYTTLVFSKALKLRNNHLPIGEIVNMVSSDSAKFAGGRNTCLLTFF